MDKQTKDKTIGGCIGTLAAWILIAVLWFFVSAGAIAVGAWCFGYTFKWKFAVFGSMILLIITILKPDKK